MSVTSTPKARAILPIVPGRTLRPVMTLFTVGRGISADAAKSSVFIQARAIAKTNFSRFAFTVLTTFVLIVFLLYAFKSSVPRGLHTLFECVIIALKGGEVMDIGGKIQEARKNAGLTQKELAQRLGVAAGTIQQYELNKRRPRAEQLIEIANILNVTVGFLLGYENIQTAKIINASRQHNGKELENLLGLEPGSIVSFFETRELKKCHFNSAEMQEILEKLDKLIPEAQLLVLNQISVLLDNLLKLPGLSKGGDPVAVDTQEDN